MNKEIFEELWQDETDSGFDLPDSAKESLRSFCDKYAERLQDRIAELEQELSEMKDYANGLIELGKDFMPICPDKAGKMLRKAIAQGKQNRANATARIAELERFLDDVMPALRIFAETTDSEVLPKLLDKAKKLKENK